MLRLSRKDRKDALEDLLWRRLCGVRADGKPKRENESMTDVGNKAEGNAAKIYLIEIRTAEAKIRQKEEEIRLLREGAACIKGQQTDAERVQTSPNGSGFTRMIDKAADLERELIKEIESLNLMRHKRIAQIQQLDLQYSDLLFQRYVLGRDLWYISEYLNMRYGYVRKIHGRALEDFAKRFLTEEK